MIMLAIHRTAVVDPHADLAEDVTVGPHAMIEADVRIGRGTVIGPGVCVLAGTTLGEENRIHAHAVLGDVPQDVHFKGGRTYCVIGDRNVIREHVTVHRGTMDGSATRIGSDCLLMASSHVAHNCVVGDRVVTANGALLGGHVEVGERAFISGNAVVHQHTRVGRLAMLAGVARATRDVPPFALVAGENRIYGVNRVGMRRAGLTAQAMSAIARAYRAMFMSGRAADEAAREIVESSGAEPEAVEIARFVLASKRGLCSYASRRRAARAAPASSRPDKGGPDFMPGGEEP
jgi:UDP-N-acetylglucosamine acyltransferase